MVKLFYQKDECRRLWLHMNAHAKSQLLLCSPIFSDPMVRDAIISASRRLDGNVYVLADEVIAKSSTAGIRTLEAFALAGVHLRLGRGDPLHYAARDESGQVAHADIHSKMIIADRRVLGVGSRNASVRGLSSYDTMGVVMGRSEVVAAVESFAAEWEAAKPFSLMNDQPPPPQGRPGSRRAHCAG